MGAASSVTVAPPSWSHNRMNPPAATAALRPIDVRLFPLAALSLAARSAVHRIRAALADSTRHSVRHLARRANAVIVRVMGFAPASSASPPAISLLGFEFPCSGAKNSLFGKYQISGNCSEAIAPLAENPPAHRQNQSKPAKIHEIP
jgi:hypothetical protein